MSWRKANVVLPIFVALMLLMALTARATAANDSKVTSAQMDFLDAVSLGGTQISPGTYSVIVDDSKVTVKQGGKMIAEAPIQWKDQARKAPYSNIVTVGDQVTEIHFGGKTRYAAITQSSAASGK